MVTNWYPTKENPMAGCFFKEQAFATEEYLDFVVFRYQEKYTINPFLKDYAKKYNVENNTVEYEAVAYISSFMLIIDFFYNIHVIKRKRNTEGIGRYIS